MDTREQRGIELANTRKIIRKAQVYFVPSQSGPGEYQVTIDDVIPKCTCPDFEMRKVKCKHIFAVEFTVKRECDKDGNTTVTQTLTVKRKTYKQNWPAYNAAQSQEKAQFAVLLNDLCKDIQDPVQAMGRKRHSLRDLIFSSAYKVYSTVSGRRFTTRSEERRVGKECRL